ncbi:hypothetical protein D3Z47_19010 [Lachnospiraceae bacterium]|nr:hypothetical protein [Lachnospiraceae bacterium]
MPVNALDIDTENTNAVELENISEENSNSKISSETTVNTVEHSLIQDNVSEIESENDSSSIETEIPNNENLITTENEENSLPIEEEDTSNEVSLQNDTTEEDSEQRLAVERSSVEEEPAPTDNWELSTVFYDSTVNNGRTPLTEINWDASDGSYKEGTPRVITEQITYKNSNIKNNYAPGELSISIPNLIYNASQNKDGSPYWQTSVVVSANEPSRTGFDWTFMDGKTAPSEKQETYYFFNDIPFEEKTNFEGTIQITYTITPKAESGGTINNVIGSLYPNVEHPNDYIEGYENSCIHEYNTQINASLKKVHLVSDEQVGDSFTSRDSSDQLKIWEFNYPDADIIKFEFNSNANLGWRNHFYFYNDKNTNITSQVINTTKFFAPSQTIQSSNDYLCDYQRDKTYYYFGRYINLRLYARDSHNFTLNIKPISFDSIAESNNIEMNYRREYIHPWEKAEYTITKTASKITTMDLFPQDAQDYIWVKYGFSRTGASYSSGFVKSSYPKIYATPDYWVDTFPEGCVVYNSSMSRLTPIYENTYKEKLTAQDGYKNYIYVGYPRSIYNEQNGNLNITNTVQLVGTYHLEEDESLLAEGSCSLNLADFEFSYSGNLYGITKFFYKGQNATMHYQKIVGEKNSGVNDSYWHLASTAIYTGTPMTIKVGDDLLYSLDSNGNYSRVKDDEYYFSEIYWDSSYFQNSLGYTIQNEKYDCELWVRYKDSDEYVLYDSFKNKSYTWNFSEEDAVVGFYFIVHDIQESLNGKKGSQYSWINARTIFKKKDIPQSGQLYNFGYAQVFFKDENGNLILQNEPGIDSYSNLITKEEIASFDLETYGTYMQRSTAKANWIYYTASKAKVSLSGGKSFGNITQNDKEQLFTGDFDIYGYVPSSNINFDYLEQYNSDSAYLGLIIYDLLPKGMEIDSSSDEILNSLEFNDRLSNGAYYPKLYDTEFNIIDNYRDVISKEDMVVTISKNWRNTGRDFVKIEIPFKQPVFNGNYLKFLFNIKYKVPYDTVLEYGPLLTNYCYVGGYPGQKNLSITGNKCKDDGSFDKDILDINDNGIIDEELYYSRAITTITSAFQTHQDVQKQVKTDKSNYSTGTVQAGSDSEYTYKLRVRTGKNDITNLVIYDSIEEYVQDPYSTEQNFITAYGTKKHWNGDFLGIDTSYAESKGYTVKPYYSEDKLAGDLYNKDGTLNSDWKEYYTYNYAPANGLAVKFDDQFKFEGTSTDYIEIYYKDEENNIYKLGRYGGTSLAGQTINIPSDNFYIYFYSDSSVVDYGYKVESITPAIVDENSITKTKVTNLPSGTVTELTGNNYPETEHDYKNSQRLLWHYTYTGNMQVIGKTPVESEKVKTLAFEYLDENGNSAILPSGSMTYVLVRMKSPVDESITTLAYNGCRTEWNALDNNDRPVDFVTGINSNIVKVALPNSKEDEPIINLSFVKSIDGNDEAFEKLQLKKDDTYRFQIILTNRETGAIIKGILDSKTGLQIKEIPIGTYLIKEPDDMYFDFVDMTADIVDGIIFENTEDGYLLTIDNTISEDTTFEIIVNNKIESDRPYEDKKERVNLFGF